MEGTRPGYSGGTGVRNAAASPPSPPPPSTSHGNVLKAKVQKKNQPTLLCPEMLAGTAGRTEAWNSFLPHFPLCTGGISVVKQILLLDQKLTSTSAFLLLPACA